MFLVGFEPGTPRTWSLRSTNWAIKASQDYIEIRADIRMLASGREMDPDHISLSQGCRNFQLYARLDFRYWVRRPRRSHSETVKHVSVAQTVQEISTRGTYRAAPPIGGPVHNNFFSLLGHGKRSDTRRLPFKKCTMAFFGRLEMTFFGARRDLRAANESLGLWDSGATYKWCLRCLGERQIQVKVWNLLLSGIFEKKLSI